MALSQALGAVHEHGGGAPWVMLHGFTQSGACFDELAAHMGVLGVAPDLPGHGAATQEGISFESATHAIAELLEARGAPLPLLGYSQGGRLALHVALARPELVSRLVIISAAPGIPDAEARAERARLDEERAMGLLESGLEGFLEAWGERAMFSGLQRRGSLWLERDRERRRSHSAAGLAAALRGLGLGQQEDLLPRLGQLAMPALFIAGVDDPAYMMHALQMAEAAPQGMPVFLPGVGHAAVGEAPETVSRVIGQAG